MASLIKMLELNENERMSPTEISLFINNLRSKKSQRDKMELPDNSSMLSKELMGQFS